jgi:hypothetical protein
MWLTLGIIMEVCDAISVRAEIAIIFVHARKLPHRWVIT